jgi:hypothetical protein
VRVVKILVVPFPKEPLPVAAVKFKLVVGVVVPAKVDKLLFTPVPTVKVNRFADPAETVVYVVRELLL